MSDRAAVDGLLAALGDPATHTTADPEATPPVPAPAEPATRILDGMLVVSCRGMSGLMRQGGSSEAGKAITDYLGGSPKGVVFDCRTRGADRQAQFIYRYVVGLVDRMVSGTVTLATYRERQHSGFAPQPRCRSTQV